MFKNIRKLLFGLSMHDLNQYRPYIEDFNKSIEIYEVKEYFTEFEAIVFFSEWKSIFMEPLKYNTGKSELGKSLKNIRKLLKNEGSLAKRLRENYYKNMITNSDNVLSNISGLSLDTQQRKAVLCGEENVLVIAGAGSGKTLTIAGKVSYLVNYKKVDPKKILLISFTKDSANEMKDRIKNKLRIDVDVKTFHKLGFDILKASDKITPKIDNDFLELVIEGYLRNHILKSVEQSRALIDFFAYYLNASEDANDFDTLDEYYKSIKEQKFETLKDSLSRYGILQINRESKKTIKGEFVKSYEELMIANFYFISGIEYEYERDYEYKTETNEFAQYRPDFYLPKYKIYHEHFGVDKDNKVPWLGPIEEKKYQEGMLWKRELHNEKSTTLIETFSYQKSDGDLLDKLKYNLINLGVEFSQKNLNSVLKGILLTDSSEYKLFINLISDFIRMYQSTGRSISCIDEVLSTRYLSGVRLARTKLFIKLVVPIYRLYFESKMQNNLIDFNDMIINSTKLIEDKSIKLEYDYIIVDEYQDISKIRLNLVDSIKKQNNSQLFCVGDDWQSIFRFAGSDLNLFTGFDNRLGNCEILRIEKTYRNSQELVDIAGKFVMKNPHQYKKNLKSISNVENPVIIDYFKNENDIITKIKNSIDKLVEVHGQDISIMLIGRNNFDFKILSTAFKVNKEYVFYQKYPDLVIRRYTAHSSKGLEADHVIIINCSSKEAGFPSRVQSDYLLENILSKLDNFRFAEERRLFYVALTRAKFTVTLIVPVNRQSAFVKEIKEYRNVSVLNNSNEKTEQVHICPYCKGDLLKSKYGYYCINKPFCSYRGDIRMNLKKKCDKCGDYLIWRKTKDGKRGFYGCNSYKNGCK